MYVSTLKSFCMLVWVVIHLSPAYFPPFFPPFLPFLYPPFPRLLDPERVGGHMISRDDLEYPREYRTLGNNARRFSNVGLVHTSEHRHTVSAAQSLEALTNLHKADMERKRDAFMDHLKSKYQQQQQQQQQLQHPHHSPHHNPPSPSPSHASMRGTSERSAREQVININLLVNVLATVSIFHFVAISRDTSKRQLKLEMTNLLQQQS